MLRDWARKYSRSFDVSSRVILNIEFLRAINIYQLLQLMENEYMVPKYMLEWVIATCQGKPQVICMHMYILVVTNHHYFAIEIVFVDSTIYLYNSDRTCLTQGELEHILEPVYVIVHLMARHMEVIVHARLTIMKYL